VSLAQIRANFKRLQEGIPLIATKAAEAGAAVVLEADQNNLFPGHGFDTGALHDAQIMIQTEDSSIRKTFAIGTDQDAPALAGNGLPPREYDASVEFGTSKMAPIPHLRPAVDQNRDAVRGAIEDELIAGIDGLIK
jgi:HK97 gp10 family phage protein